jgi:hypothetical protein
MKHYHADSTYFFIKIMTFLFIIYLMVGCERGNTQANPTEFLKQKSVIVPNLTGEWSWINTHGGWGGMITPETEGYYRSIIFTSQQNYIEIKDKSITLQTYYKIDSTKLDHYGEPIFKITYFDEIKISQNFIIQQSYDTICLYLYDNDDCSDCLSTSVYRKQQ